MNDDDEKLKLNRVLAEVESVLEMLDELARLWGDEGVFRRCRDRLRYLVENGDVPYPYE